MLSYLAEKVERAEEGEPQIEVGDLTSVVDGGSLPLGRHPKIAPLSSLFPCQALASPPLLCFIYNGSSSG